MDGVIKGSVFAAMLGLGLPVMTATAADLEQQAIGLVKQFGGTLKPQLKQAMQQGGPESAIDVCASKAPQIARKLSADSGWNIKRVSLKNRNPDAAPDTWELRVLNGFERQLAAGTPASELKVSQHLDGEYRFMKAQLVEPVCLTCHGVDVAEPLRQKIGRHYPADKAMGYSLGQVRGAFSLSLKLAE